MKKGITWLLVVSMFLSLLVGMASAEEQKTITFWHGQTKLEAAFNELAARYEAETGVKVEVVYVESSAYKEKLKISMAGGEVPDIYQHWGGGPLVSYIESGNAIDLTAYMEADGYKDVWMDSAIEMCSNDGKIYAAPGVDLSAVGVYYNKEIFAQYGLEVPKTLAELEAVCDTLVANGIIPFTLANASKWTGSYYFVYLADRFANGPQVFNDAANRVNGGTFEAEPFVKAGQTIQDWVKKGYFPEGTNAMAHSTGDDRQLLYAGKAAMWIYAPSGVGLVASESPETYAKLGVFRFPTVEATDEPQTVIGSAGQNFFSISGQCEDPDAAFGFLKLLGDPEWVQTVVSNGLVPPVKGAMEYVSDPLRAEVLSFLDDCSAVQLAYDTYLSPVLGELHKEQMQSYFGLTETPEELCKIFEEEALMEE